MSKLNLMATFWLLHLKFTGSRIIVISFSFMKINGLIVNYLKKNQQLAQKMQNSRIFVAIVRAGSLRGMMFIQILS